MTSQTGAIAAMQRFIRRRKKIDVHALRFFCGTGRPAENSGRSHPGIKYSFKTWIALEQGAIHRVRRWKKLGHFHRLNIAKTCGLHNETIRARHDSASTEF